MTTPLLPFSFINVWGSPLHGRVKGSVLTLPNATSRPYPQPGTGDCYLVKFAGVPAVVRNAEAQASDEAAGYEWRNYAIVAGSNYQLHGKAIGSPWLHRDESGKVWRVEVAHSSGDLVTLTFTEFGRITLEPQEPIVFEQEVAISGTGLTNVQGIELMDVHPQGSEALFLAKQGTDRAMFRLSIAALVASCEIVKTLSEMTLDQSIDQVVVTVPDEVIDTPSYYRCKFDERTPTSPDYVPGFIEFSSSPLSDIYDEAGECKSNASSFGVIYYNVGRTTKDKTDAFQRFFWACYDQNGTEHFYSTIYKRYSYEDVNKTGSHEGAWTANATSDSEDPGNMPGSMSGSMTATHGTTTTNRQVNTYQVLRDAEVMAEHEVTLEQVEYSGFIRTFSGATPNIGLSETIVVRPGGGGHSSTPVSSDDKAVEFDGDLLSTELEVNYGAAYYLATGALLFQPSASGLPGFEVYKSTNKLVHMVVEYNYQPGFQVGIHFGPDAQDDITSEVTDLDALFCTFQPVTGQIIREQSQTVSLI